MREVFEDVYSLVMYYQYVKAGVTSIGTIMPKQDFGDSSQAFRAQIAQSTMEEKFTFIADVESFTKWYGKLQSYHVSIPPEPLLDIFQFTFCKGISKYKSWGHMAVCFKHRMLKGEAMPKRFRHKQHIRIVAEQMRGEVEEYFINKGMVTGQEVEGEVQ